MSTLCQRSCSLIRKLQHIRATHCAVPRIKQRHHISTEPWPERGGTSSLIPYTRNYPIRGKGRAGRRCPATAKLCYLPTTQCSLSRRASRLELVHGGTPHQLAPPPPLPPPPLLLVLYPQHHGQQTSVREGYSMSRSTPALRLRLLSRITLSATPVSIDNDRA